MSVPRPVHATTTLSGPITPNHGMKFSPCTLTVSDSPLACVNWVDADIVLNENDCENEPGFFAEYRRNVSVAFSPTVAFGGIFTVIASL